MTEHRIFHCCGGELIQVADLVFRCTRCPAVLDETEGYCMMPHTLEVSCEDKDCACNRLDEHLECGSL